MVFAKLLWPVDLATVKVLNKTMNICYCFSLCRYYVNNQINIFHKILFFSSQEKELHVAGEHFPGDRQ